MYFDNSSTIGSTANDTAVPFNLPEVVGFLNEADLHSQTHTYGTTLTVLVCDDERILKGGLAQEGLAEGRVGCVS